SRMDTTSLRSVRVSYGYGRAEPKGQSDAEPKVQSDAEPHAQSDAEPKVQSDAEPKVQSDAEPKVQSDAVATSMRSCGQSFAASNAACALANVSDAEHACAV